MNKNKKSEELEEQEVQSSEAVEEQVEKPEEIDFQDKYMRLYAEFDNFRKRTMREKAELISSASSGVMQELLPLIDDFDRADANATDDAKALKEGMDLIRAKFVSTLNSKGLKAMDAQPGDDFDLDKHEAIANVPAPSEEMKGKIVDVVEKGYMLGDKVLRYSKVVIGA